MISLEMRPLTAVRLGTCASELRAVLRSMLSLMDCRDLSLDVLVTGDREMAAFNRRFLGLVGPTNVLSFPSGDGGSGSQLGSICLCAEAVRREAFLYRQGVFEHLVRLLAHGLLHLLGTPHGPDMEDWTEKAVEQICRDGGCLSWH